VRAAFVNLVADKDFQGFFYERAKSAIRFRTGIVSFFSHTLAASFIKSHGFSHLDNLKFFYGGCDVTDNDEKIEFAAENTNR
jgi:predicted HAD superfamily hydrolase